MNNTYLVVDGVVYDLVERKEEVEAHNVASPAPKKLEDMGESKPCPEHPEKRLWKKKGQYGVFWSHKNEDGTWHNIKEKVEDIEF